MKSLHSFTSTRRNFSSRPTGTPRYESTMSLKPRSQFYLKFSVEPIVMLKYSVSPTQASSSSSQVDPLMVSKHE